MRRTCLLYKVLLNKVHGSLYYVSMYPTYIHDLIRHIGHSFRHPNSFTICSSRTEYFYKFFFSCVINDWNKVDLQILNSNSYLNFRNALDHQRRKSSFVLAASNLKRQFISFCAANPAMQSGERLWVTYWILIDPFPEYVM